MDAEKLDKYSLDEIRNDGRKHTVIPWKKFKKLEGVQTKTEGKDIIVKIKNADLRNIYDQRIINELDSRDVIRATAKFIDDYKSKKKSR